MIYKKKRYQVMKKFAVGPTQATVEEFLKKGERIINAGHIIYRGKNIDFNGYNVLVKLV